MSRSAAAPDIAVRRLWRRRDSRRAPIGPRRAILAILAGTTVAVRPTVADYLPMRYLAALSLTAACAAPPMGLGTGARTPAAVGHNVVEGRTGMAAASGRQTFQAEASARGQFARWFALELGVAVTRTQQEGRDGDQVNLTGGFPYLRPRFQLDRVSLAVALAGLGMGGGGGGIIGGIADAQLGYGTAAWGVYVGAYAHGFEIVSESPIDVSTRQLRIGGEYAFAMGASRLGVAIELYRQREALRNGEDQADTDGFAGGVKLSITSPEFR